MVQMQEAVCLSDCQIQDLILLRRWNLVRRHHLAMQRASLTARVQEQRLNPVHCAIGVADTAIKLHQNAVDDHQMIIRFSWAICYGVCDLQHCDDI